MSSSIYINVSKFDSYNSTGISRAKKCSAHLTESITRINKIKSSLSPEVLNKKNIHSDLTKVGNKIDEVDSKIKDIRAFLLEGAERYLQAERNIKKLQAEHKALNKQIKATVLKETLFNVGKAVVVATLLAVVIVIGIYVAPLIGAAIPAAIALVKGFIVVSSVIDVGSEVLAFMTGIDRLHINPLEIVMINIGGFIGKFFGAEEFGRELGENVSNLIEMATFVFTLGKSAVKVAGKSAVSLINTVKNLKFSPGLLVQGVKKLPQTILSLPKKAATVGKGMVMKSLSSLCNAISVPMIKGVEYLKKAGDFTSHALKGIFNKQFLSNAFTIVEDGLKNKESLSSIIQVMSKNTSIQKGILDFKFYKTSGKVYLKQSWKHVSTSLLEAVKVVFHFEQLVKGEDIATSLIGAFMPKGLSEEMIKFASGLDSTMSVLALV